MNRDVLDVSVNKPAIETIDCPIRLRPLELQVAGHASDSKYGILQEDSGKIIFKPEQHFREREFYEKIFFDSHKDSALIALCPFIPTYHGRFHTSKTNYMKLENVLARFRLPSIMDVKIGKITAEPGASPEKIQREKEKYKGTKDELGFCIPGIKVFNQQTQKYDFYDKQFGKKLNTVTVKDALRMFLNTDSRNSDLTDRFCHHLDQIRNWFLEQKLFKFYSTSLLLVYESALENLQEGHIADTSYCKVDDSENGSNTMKIFDDLTDVRMIDFVHVVDAEGSLDDNYLFGLENLIRTLKELNL